MLFLNNPAKRVRLPPKIRRPLTRLFYVFLLSFGCGQFWLLVNSDFKAFLPEQRHLRKL